MGTKVRWCMFACLLVAGAVAYSFLEITARVPTPSSHRMKQMRDASPIFPSKSPADHSRRNSTPIPRNVPATPKSTDSSKRMMKTNAQTARPSESNLTTNAIQAGPSTPKMKTNAQPTGLSIPKVKTSSQPAGPSTPKVQTSAPPVSPFASKVKTSSQPPGPSTPKVQTSAPPASPFASKVKTSAKPVVSNAKQVLKVVKKAPTEAKFDKRTELNIKLIKKKELSKEAKLVLLDLLKTFMRVADELGLVWFMDAGTLIGSWRHHGFVPWDDDLDILVNNSQKGALLKRFKAMEPEYIGHDGHPIIKLHSNRSTLKINHVQHRWPFLDILFFHENGDMIWNNPKWVSSVKFSKKAIFPLHKRPFENIMANAPRNTPRYLEALYHMKQPSECATGFYDHRREQSGLRVIHVPCEALKDIYPFVDRQYLNTTMKETLKIGNRIIHLKYVKEPKENLTPMFSIKSVKPGP